MLDSVDYADGSYVAYKYDAFGRKIGRTEAYFTKNSEFVPPGQQKESKSNGNGNSQGNGNAYGQGNGNAYGQGNGNGNNKPLKLETDTTLYSYDGLGVNVLNEYTGNGAPLGEYYYAGQSIIGKKMFGNHGLDGRSPDLQTTGGLMYYQYDGLQNVSSLTNRLGEVIEDYRYDVFGNLYTGITAPYNTYGFTGMKYDPKAGLVNMHARWYAPDTGRFITPDSYSGDLMQPYTQNLYAYVGNNPVNRWDPLGYAESDMPGFFSNDYSSGDYLYQNLYVKAGYWYNSSTSGSLRKGSDGWYNSWTDTLTEYWLYDHAYFKLKYTGETSPDFGPIYETVESSLTQTTFSHTSSSSGTDFRPFTSEEWYNEHKDDLLSYGSLPEDSQDPGSAAFSYTCETSGNSSGTETLLTIISGENTVNYKFKDGIIQEQYNQVSGNTGINSSGSSVIIKDELIPLMHPPGDGSGTNNQESDNTNLDSLRQSINFIIAVMQAANKGAENSTQETSDDKKPCVDISEFKARYGELINQYAKEFGVDPNVLGAIIYTESSGGGFYDNCTLKIRFEDHIFTNSWAGTNGKYKEYFIHNAKDYSKRCIIQMVYG